jgi:hypothetical protein
VSREGRPDERLTREGQRGGGAERGRGREEEGQRGGGAERGRGREGEGERGWQTVEGNCVSKCPWSLFLSVTWS